MKDETSRYSDYYDKGPGYSCADAMRTFLIAKLDLIASDIGCYDDYGSVAYFEDGEDLFLVSWRWSSRVISIISASTSSYADLFDYEDWSGDPEDYLEKLSITQKMGKVLFPFIFDKFGPLEKLASAERNIESVVREESVEGLGRVMKTFVSPLQ